MLLWAEEYKKKLNCSKNFRCACIKNGKKYSKFCKCRRCGNKEIVDEAHVSTRRTRIPHELSTSIQPPSLQYLLSTNESLGPFISNVQHFVLEASLYILLKNRSFHSIMDVEEDLIAEELFQQCLTLHEEVKESPDSINCCIKPNVFQIDKLLINRWVRKKTEVISYEQNKLVFYVFLLNVCFFFSTFCLNVQ